MTKLVQRRYARLSMIALAGAALTLAACAPTKGGTPQVRATFNCVSGPVQQSQSYTVPAGVTQLSITALGGAGADGRASGANAGGAGGKGGSASATFAVTPGEVLTVNVGCAPVDVDK